jgi:hypothetical protein
MTDAERIYDRITATLERERAGLLHPDFPLEVIERRSSLARRMPLHVTASYAAQIVADRDGLAILKLIRFGDPQLAEVASIFGTAFDLADKLGCAFRVEPPNAQTLSYYADFVDVDREGAYFLVYDPTVTDALDRFRPELSFADPFPSCELPGLGRVRVGPFATTLDLSAGCADPTAVISRLSEEYSVVMVSAPSREDVEALYAFFAGRDELVVGRPFAYFGAHINRERIATFRRFAERHPVRLRLLIDGRFYDCP